MIIAADCARPPSGSWALWGWRRTRALTRPNEHDPPLDRAGSVEEAPTAAHGEAPSALDFPLTWPLNLIQWALNGTRWDVEAACVGARLRSAPALVPARRPSAAEVGLRMPYSYKRPQLPSTQGTTDDDQAQPCHAVALRSRTNARPSQRDRSARSGGCSSASSAPEMSESSSGLELPSQVTRSLRSAPAADASDIGQARWVTRPSPWEPSAHTEAPIDAVSPAPPNGTTILIVENEQSNRMLLEKILGFAGFRCLTACNGLEALEVFDREGPDLILTDISMPIMDGYQTVAAIRARLDGATVPIVAVTAHAMTGDREQAIEQGCTEYLAKPYRPGDLLRVVERLVNKGSS